jgi:hypothetical protein
MVGSGSWFVITEKMTQPPEIVDEEPEEEEEQHRVELTPDDCTMLQKWFDNDCIDLIGPNSLNYGSSDVIWRVGENQQFLPSFSGDGPDAWSVQPPLPNGIWLDNSGVIKGAPLEYDSLTTTYLITASNPVGVTITELNISMIDIPPLEFNYPDSPYTFTYGDYVSQNPPLISGGEIITWEATLPAGFYIDYRGSLVGTALELGVHNITVFANNSGGSSNATISILVVDHAVSNLRYTDAPLSTFVNETMYTLIPSLGGGAVIGWGVTGLPAGLSFDNGTISGIPSGLGTHNFEVFANNSGGSASVLIQIFVVDRPVSSIIFPMELSFVWKTAVNISANTSGGPVVEWGFSPTLPNGLIFEQGRIYGIANTIHSQSVLKIWANNSGGSYVEEFNLSISDMTPGNISWFQSIIAFEANSSVQFNVENLGPAIDSWQIEPSLPDGLSLLEGNITGTPSERTGWQQYIIWANNSGGSLELSLELAVHDLDADWNDLADGVGTLDYGSSWPSLIVPHGRWSFPVGVDWNNRPIITASHAQKGKIIGYGHEGFVAQSSGNESIMSLNAIDWVCDGSDIGLVSRYNFYEDDLTAEGYSVTTSIDVNNLSGYDCILAEFWNSYGNTGNNAIEAFLLDGGGVVMGGHAWYWSYSNSDVANNYPGNSFAQSSGLFVSTSSGSVGLDLRNAPSQLHRPNAAIQAVENHIYSGPLLNDADKIIAGGCVQRIADHLPMDWPGFWPQIRQMVNTTGWIDISSSNPFDLGADGIDDMFLGIQESLIMQLPVDQLPLHPSAKNFPGSVPANATLETRTITIDGDYSGLPSNFGYAGARSAGRFSTGLYASPGAVVNISVPSSVIDTGVGILVGAHSDSLWAKDTVSRHPRITRGFSASNANFSVGNAFGGPIYITIPAGSTLGLFDVIIEDAIAAPTYIHNQTTFAEWNNTQRHNPAPWTELVSSKFILTVPSSEIRNLDNPIELMNWWETALQMEHYLSGLSDWPRVERAVFDVQISAGWMHSGYPFMAHLASVSSVVDLDHMNTSGDWGMFHELGHNHQWMPSTLPGTTEATCNLYSVYLMEDLVGVELGQGHGALQNSSRISRRDTYFNGGSQISQWSVWTALETYLQVKEEFGWAPITFALSEYYSMSNPPSGSTEEFNQWTIRISNATGWNLAPFHAAWGFPLTPETFAALDHLPVWTDDPQRNGTFEYDLISQNLSSNNITSNSADLSWSVYDNGTNTNQSICWGLVDGGTNKATWTNCSTHGISTVGNYSKAVNSLSSGLTYHWRILGENSNGGAWSPDHTFTTS